MSESEHQEATSGALQNSEQQKPNVEDMISQIKEGPALDPESLSLKIMEITDAAVAAAAETENNGPAIAKPVYEATSTAYQRYMTDTAANPHSRDPGIMTFLNDRNVAALNVLMGTHSPIPKPETPGRQVGFNRTQPSLPASSEKA